MRRAAVAALLLTGATLCAAPLQAQHSRPLQAQQSSPLLDFSSAELAAIAAHGPWPMPASASADPSNRVQNQPAAQRLGRALFFDRALAAGGKLSCASCHQPARAFQDGLPVARARDALLRNTPSLLDVAQQRWWGWDGASDSLWAASVVPLLAAGEMGHSIDGLAARVRNSPRHRAAYRQAFGSTPEALSDSHAVVGNLGKALAAYQATLVSPRTPFDDFRDALQRGDLRAAARYPLAAQRGLRLFVGGARCSVCHSGPAFSNREFADIGRPFFVPGGGVDAGRHGGLLRLLASPLNRLGAHNDAAGADPRALLTQQVLPQHRNFGEFRVPGLRQLLHTAPYMHDGSLTRIEDVVRHYSELDEERLHADGERILQRLNLSAGQAADMAAFLRSLSTR